MTIQLRATVLAVLIAGAGAVGYGAASLGDDPAAFDQQIDNATLKNDPAFLEAVLSDDARFTHVDGRQDDKRQWVQAARTSKALRRTVDSIEVERHGDVIETVGVIHVKQGNAQQSEYHLYYVRVYALRAGSWQLLSHRTHKQVNGPLPAK